MGTRHVVWDWNGTVLDDSAVVLRTSHDVFAAGGFGPITDDQYRAAFRRPIRGFYEDLVGSKLSDEQWHRLDDLFHETYATREKDIQLAHGVVEVFAHIKAQGWTQSLLSMAPHEMLLAHVERHSIKDVFARVDGARVGSTGNSKAEYLVRHLAALGVDPAETLLIGDAVDDVDAAHYAGTSVIFYASGLHSDDVVAGLNVPVAHNMSDVLRMVGEKEAGVSS